MVPNREGKRLLAVVEPASCVSCGICAASCADLAIGPPGRSAQDQIDRAHGFADGTVEAGGIPRIVAISCIANAGVELMIRDWLPQRIPLLELSCRLLRGSP